MKKNYRYKIITLTLLCCICIFNFTSCYKENNSSNQQSVEIPPPSEETPNHIIEFIGIVIENLDDYSCFRVLNTLTMQPQMITVDGSVDVFNKYGEPIALAQIQLGTPVFIRCNSTTMTAESITISKDMWELVNSNNLNIDYNKHTITYGSTIYEYSDNVVVVSDNTLISIDELINIDRVTLIGYDKNIYSIKVNTGHGYLTLKNYSYYIGGSISSKNFYADIISNMMVTIPEGTHSLQIKKNFVDINTTVSVSRNETVEIDMSTYKNKIPKTGQIKFNISPSNSTLFINNIAYNYSQLIDLEYGTYTIEVSHKGYNTRKGSFTISAPYRTFSVTLNKLKESDTSNDNSSNVTAAKSTIKSTAGASVYLNGKLIGTSPVTFSNTLGNHVVTISKQGYYTKTFNIIINDLTQSYNFDFKELVPLPTQITE